ncbi:MAG: ribonuclease Y [Chloroflexi bacterium]|nr:ribonuclease Y [Chloroflexota bacterium]
MNGGGRVIWIAVEVIVAALLGGGLGYLVAQYLNKTRMREKEERAQMLIAEAEAKAKDIIIQAKDAALKLRESAEAEIERRRQDLQRQEERLQQRRESLDRRMENLENRERKLDQRQSRIDKMESEIQQLHDQRIKELERIAAMTQEEAKQLLLEMVEQSARQDAARIIREVEAEAREQAEEKAREIITVAIQRLASDQVSETTVSVVPLPNDEMKGRIIGRGGRNIRAIENATGVDLIVDDTPEAVTISSFDPVRREIARLALSKLITDGRIHPARIEKLVKKAEQEVEAIIREDGERAALEVGVHGLRPELINLIGRLRYRTSYGQNVYLHSLESAHLAGMMAAELGANVQVAKMGALLHDIGKAVDHEVEGPHAIVGAEIARRYGVSPDVVNCIAGHHNEEEPQSLEAIIVQAADAISGARPGARRESLEAYVKRIKALEEVANSFPGVAQSFAIQAGREIRIIVKPEEIDDLAAIELSKNIARKIEESLEYPGQIKISVIRETRAVEYAK